MIRIFFYIHDELANISKGNPAITLQITAQDEGHDCFDILSGMFANVIAGYLVQKGVNVNRCLVNKNATIQSKLPPSTAVVYADGINLDDLLMQSFILPYKGDSKEMIIRNDNYCIQFGAFTTQRTVVTVG